MGHARPLDPLALVGARGDLPAKRTQVRLAFRQIVRRQESQMTPKAAPLLASPMRGPSDAPKGAPSAGLLPPAGRVPRARGWSEFDHPDLRIENPDPTRARPRGWRE
ncbi:MAG: hypothetical protein BroJett031_35750 [Betaproteobacteria bacterium]|nr:MAG: hypothetical protein BroJett031_35750 [Betaproteobacteria bacterium]